MMRKTWIPAAVLFALICACGTQGDILGSQRNLPDARITCWEKVDLFPDIELVQAFVFLAGHHEEFLEPHLMTINGIFWCFSKIVAYSSPDGMTWEMLNNGLPVLTASAEWEQGFVGAPSVIHRDGEFVMYFAGGRGRGIGIAKSPDGLAWTKEAGNPVIVPDQSWEGGVVSAPSVLPVDGVLHLWYSGGTEGTNIISRQTGNAIGLAREVDENVFEKADAEGGRSIDGSGDVEPVLAADAEWEGFDPNTPGSGFASSPCVVVMKTPHRRILQMFYAGGEPGDIGHGDASIGFAGSEDGMVWEKAALDVNPIIQEIFGLSLPGISDHFNFDEWAPTVLHRDDRSFMLFSQKDLLNWLSHDMKGIALATNPVIH